MFYRIMKFAGQSSYILLGWLTWLWFHGGLSWEFSLSCLAVSGFWLALTVLGMRQLFTTYFDVMSRLKVLLPVVTGIALAGLAVYTTKSETILVGAALELVAWTGVYLLYRRNRKQYMTKGHGPLPKGTWINPPKDVLRPGDLLLTSGRIATRLHESVGHGEVVVMGEDGRLKAFSSYMERGTVLNPVELLTRKPESRGHYVVSSCPSSAASCSRKTTAGAMKPAPRATRFSAICPCRASSKPGCPASSRSPVTTGSDFSPAAVHPATGLASAPVWSCTAVWA